MGEDTVEYDLVFFCEQFAHSPEEFQLLLGKRPAVKIKYFFYSNAPGITTGGLDWIFAHEYSYVAAYRPAGNIKFTCEISVCIIPSQTQHLYHLLAAVNKVHILTPPLLLWNI